MDWGNILSGALQQGRLLTHTEGLIQAFQALIRERLEPAPELSASGGASSSC